MTRRHRLLLTAVLAAAEALTFGSVAVAQDAGDAEAEAREHFEVGRRLYDLGRFPEAAEAFERAYGLSERPALLMNMYLSYRDAARPRQAADALRRYIATAEIADDERARLEHRLRALDQQLAEATEAEDGATDETRAASAAAVETDVTGPVVLMAAGGAAVLAGVGTGIGAALEHDGLVAACPDQRCDVADAGRIDTVRALSITTDVLLGVGVAAAGAGLVWLLVTLSGEPPSEDAAVSTSASCGSAGCVGVLEGTW